MRVRPSLLGDGVGCAKDGVMTVDFGSIFTLSNPEQYAIDGLADGDTQ